MINTLIIYKFSRDFTNHRKKTNRTVVLAVDLSITFSTSGTTDRTSQYSGKQDSFRHILISSANTYESSGSKFFKTITGIQFGPNVIEESWLVMTFFSNLGIARIL